MSNKKTKIIALAGTSCSGKGTIVNCYKEEFGFHHRSMRQMIAEAGNKLLGKPLDQIVTRDHYRITARELRAKHGPACIVDLVLETAPRNGKPIVVESIRAIGELERLKSHPDFDVVTIFLDAPHERRYEWSQKRNDAAETGSDGVHTISYEEFVDREKQEFNPENGNDPAKQHLYHLSKMCDHYIFNDKTHHDLKHHARKIAQDLLNESQV